MHFRAVSAPVAGLQTRHGHVFGLGTRSMRLPEILKKVLTGKSRPDEGVEGRSNGVEERGVRNGAEEEGARKGCGRGF